MIKYTEEQLKNMKDMVLTHNHPKNCTFSPEDINFMVWNKLKQLDAVHRAEDGVVYTYTLKRIEGTTPDVQFAYDYKAAQDQLKVELDKQWRDSDKTQLLADHLSSVLFNYSDVWLRNNAQRYGYEYKAWKE